MNRLALALAGAVLVSGCSDSRDRRIPVDDNLTRPLEVARVDTTQPLSPVEHQATSTPEPAAMPKPRKAKRATPKATPPPPPTSVPAEDTTTRGYAPEQSPVADTAQSPASGQCGGSDPTTGACPGHRSRPDTGHHIDRGHEHVRLRATRPLHRLSRSRPAPPSGPGHFPSAPRFTRRWMIRSIPAPTQRAA